MTADAYMININDTLNNLTVITHIYITGWLFKLETCLHNLQHYGKHLLLVEGPERASTSTPNMAPRGTQKDILILKNF